VWTYRLVGLILAAAGLADLLVLSYALYSRTDFGMTFLIRLGMPGALLGALAGGFLVGAGVWLLGFPHPMDGRNR
jgi:hypothetical protein